MYLTNQSVFELEWNDVHSTDPRMYGSRCFEFDKMFGDTVTYKININDFTETIYSSYWITITDTRQNATFSFEVSRWECVCSIVNGLV